MINNSTFIKALKKLIQSDPQYWIENNTFYYYHIQKGKSHHKTLYKYTIVNGKLDKFSHASYSSLIYIFVFLGIGIFMLLNGTGIINVPTGSANRYDATMFGVIWIIIVVLISAYNYFSAKKTMEKIWKTSRNTILNKDKK